MSTQTHTTVEMFGALHVFRKDHGLEAVAEIDLPAKGRTAYDLAHDLNLPLKMIKAVFINHVVHSLNDVIQQGDSVAFIPTGVPGSMQIKLNVFNAGLH